MRVRTVLKKWKSKVSVAGVTAFTLWMLSAYPPAEPIWRYIALKGAVPGVWIVAGLIWVWPHAKARVLRFGLLLIPVVFLITVLWFLPVGETLKINTFYIPADYQSGSVIGGIPWEQFYTDVRVQIRNSSSEDDNDVDLLINASDPIDRIGQISSLKCVELFSASDPSKRPRIIGLSTDKGETIPAQGQRFSRDGYRLRCSTLPRQSTIELVLATVNINPNPLGNRQLFGPKHPPKEISIEGRYTANQIQHSIHQSLSVQSQ